MFYYEFVALAGIRSSKLDVKFEIFRNFGLSDATIYKVVARFPNIVMTSEDIIRKHGTSSAMNLDMHLNMWLLTLLC